MFWNFSQIYQKVKVHKMFKIFSILDNIKIQQLGDVLEWFFRGFLKVNLSNQSFSWCVQFAGRVGNDICGVPKRGMGGCKREGNNETRSRNSRRYCRTSEWSGPKVDSTYPSNHAYTIQQVSFKAIHPQIACLFILNPGWQRAKAQRAFAEKFGLWRKL